jgi:NAD(P)-dependent dehydrogenase (short-subunit alcohol dehydrogenase family)
VNVRKRIVDYTDAELDRVVDLNLKGTFRLTRAFGALMAAAGTGSMIGFTSIRSQTTEPGQGAYAATKAATVMLFKTLAAELGPQGVRANTIAPGVVETPLTQPIKDRPEWYDAYADKAILKRWAAPSELVGAVVFLASDAASYVTGTTLFVDGGWTAADGRFEPPS